MSSETLLKNRLYNEESKKDALYNNDDLYKQIKGIIVSLNASKHYLKKYAILKNLIDDDKIITIACLSEIYNQTYMSLPVGTSIEDTFGSDVDRIIRLRINLRQTMSRQSYYNLLNDKYKDIVSDSDLICLKWVEYANLCATNKEHLMDWTGAEDFVNANKKQ